MNFLRKIFKQISREAGEEDEAEATGVVLIINKEG
jgi:hypothetical protein